MKFKIATFTFLALSLAACTNEECPPTVSIETPAGIIRVSSEADAELLRLLIKDVEKQKQLNSGSVKPREIGKGGY
ncbi:hypothetical protein [Microbulbifer aggregans]|uniref:hypothetical protein n=1 Tax=Microbulbifer aggregans TaxID=1769779 RepID=UPI001CFDA845|nr:hypothetical protein [Microbulbifer aggregans]